MCDYSIQAARSRPAKVGDRLTNRKFGSGARGFAAPEDADVAVCLLPGTELSFVEAVAGIQLWPWSKLVKHRTAIFRQVNMRKRRTHHDALEFPDGRSVLLTLLCEGQAATVLQLPAQPKTEAEAREQERVDLPPPTISAWRYVCFQARSSPFPARWRACRLACLVGRPRPSTTRPPSSVRSTKRSWPHITMRSSFPMGAPCC